MASPSSCGLVLSSGAAAPWEAGSGKEREETEKETSVALAVPAAEPDRQRQDGAGAAGSAEPGAKPLPGAALCPWFSMGVPADLGGTA